MLKSTSIRGGATDEYTFGCTTYRRQCREAQSTSWRIVGVFSTLRTIAVTSSSPSYLGTEAGINAGIEFKTKEAGS